MKKDQTPDQKLSPISRPYKYLWHIGLKSRLLNIDVHGALKLSTAIQSDLDKKQTWWRGYISGGIHQAGVRSSMANPVIVAIASIWLAIVGFTLEFNGELGFISSTFLILVSGLVFGYIAIIYGAKESFLSLRRLPPVEYANAMIGRLSHIATLKAVIYECFAVVDQFYIDTQNLAKALEQFKIYHTQANQLAVTKAAKSAKFRASTFHRSISRILALKEIASERLRISEQLFCDNLIGFSPLIFQTSINKTILLCDDCIQMGNTFEENVESDLEISRIFLEFQFMHTSVANLSKKLKHKFIRDAEQDLAIRLMNATSRTRGIRILARHITEFAVNARQKLGDIARGRERVEIWEDLFSNWLLIPEMAKAYPGMSLIDGLFSMVDKIKDEKFGNKFRECFYASIPPTEAQELMTLLELPERTTEMLNDYLSSYRPLIIDNLNKLLDELFKGKTRKFIISIGASGLIRDIISDISCTDDKNFTYIVWGFNDNTDFLARLQRTEVRNKFLENKRKRNYIPFVSNRSMDDPLFEKDDGVVLLMDAESFVRDDKNVKSILTRGSQKDEIEKLKNRLGAEIVFVGGEYKKLNKLFVTESDSLQDYRDFDVFGEDESYHLVSEASADKSPSPAPSRAQTFFPAT